MYAFVEDFSPHSPRGSRAEAPSHVPRPWLLRLELDRAKMIDCKLQMAYVANCIAMSFKADLFVICSEDNADKLIIRCRVLGGADKDEQDVGPVEEDISLRQLRCLRSR